jgi:hypothetical protein
MVDTRRDRRSTRLFRSALFAKPISHPIGRISISLGPGMGLGMRFAQATASSISLDFPEPETSDQLAGIGERAVDNCATGPVERNALAFRGSRETLRQH